MDTSFKIHLMSQKLIILLRECLGGSKTEICMNNLNFILKKYQKNHAELHLISHQYKNIAQIVQIKYLQNFDCFRCINKANNDYFIYVGKGEIKAFRAEKKDKKYQAMQLFCSNLLKLQKNVEIEYLSESFELSSSINLISYTNTDEFYLINLSFQNPDKKQFEIIKLVDLDNPQASIFSFNWFRKQKKQHYSSIKVQLINNENRISDNHTYFLCARDNTISLIQLHIDKELPKSSFKTLDKHILSLSSQKYKIRQILSYYDDSLMARYGENNGDNRVIKCILIYQSQNDRQIAFKFLTIDKQMTMKVDLMQSTISSLEFNAMICHDHLYISTIKQQNRICYRFHLNNVQDQVKNMAQVQPYFIRNHRMELVGNDKQLYLISPTSVQLIESDELLVGQGASQQEIQYHKNKVTINRSFGHKIKHNFDKGNMNEIVNLIQMKIVKVQQWKQHHKKYYKAVQRYVGIQLIQDLICLKLLHFILQNKMLFNYINIHNTLPPLKSTKTKTNKSQSPPINYQTLLRSALQTPNIPSLSSIICFISQQKASTQFIMIITCAINISQNLVVRQEQLKGQIEKVNDQIFREGFIRIIKILRKEVISRPYEIIVKNALQFVQISQEIIMHDLKRMVDDGRVKFVQDAILRHHLEECLVQVFDQENINFTQQYIQQLVNSIEDEAKIKQFVDKLLKKCKEVYFNDQYGKRIILRKMPQLIKGLANRTQLIEDIVKLYFPNLVPLFYIRSKQLRIQRKKDILLIGQKNLYPKHSKMLFLSVLQNDDEYTQRLIQLCEFEDNMIQST